MEAHRVYSHKNILGNRGKLSLMRGPITYCLEAIDNPNIDLFRVAVPTDARLDVEYRGDRLGGVPIVRTIGIDGSIRPFKSFQETLCFENCEQLFPIFSFESERVGVFGNGTLGLVGDARREVRVDLKCYVEDGIGVA